MEDKVFSQEIVAEVPFPGQPIITDTQSQSVAGGNFSPTTTDQKSFPVKKMAVELLSSALNTRSLKILQQFALEQSGGFQIGNFQEGVSGDLRITPNGFVARNISGIETIAVDGNTGDAIFAGELRSGTVVTGQVVVGNNTIILDGDSDSPRFLLYNSGVASILIGEGG